MRVVRLAPLYLPPADYFRAMALADLAVIDVSLRFDKRYKAVHRTRISSGESTSFLTVPISLEHSSCEPKRYADALVSPHGEWWRVQRMTLATLFGPTPFFDLFRHDIFPSIDVEAVGRSIVDLDIDLIIALRKLCRINTPMSVVLDPRIKEDPDVEIIDMVYHDFYKDPEAVSIIETLFKRGAL